MSAADLLDELTSLPESDRSAVFARLVENEQWRHDLLDLITIAERRQEPTRSIEEVFRDLQIDA
ncbi:MAG TPA: hypothetical protein VK993_12535 [Chthoniobacterales bacterium]|nr:hypothetical protein [Chthoniobacterales bacterium]